MHLIIRITLVGLFSTIFSPLSAQTVNTPEGVTVVTAPEVHRILSRNEGVLIHTLSHIEYLMQHIPGSINIPVDEVASSPLMPADKAALIVFYCNGQSCPYSKRASEIAVKQGYSQVHWFRGGILNWRKYQYPMDINEPLNSIKINKLSPEKFAAMIQGDVLVLDVRPRWWRESDGLAGVIKDTEMMIPLLRLDQSLELLPKDRPILVADRQMRQSSHAAKYLKKKGFNVQGILKGGSKRWISEGLPVLSKKDEPATLGNH